MTEQVLEDGTVTRTEYDVAGKVERVRDENDQLRLIYDYDDRGFRIRKKNIQDNVETVYVRDASGKLLSTYVKDVGQNGYQQEETPVYGSSKLGFWKHQAGLTEYELKDHLGNIRSKVVKAPEQPVNQEFSAAGPYRVANNISNFITLFQNATPGSTVRVVLEAEERVAAQITLGVLGEVQQATGGWKTYTFDVRVEEAGNVLLTYSGLDGNLRNIEATLIPIPNDEVTYFADYYPFGEVMNFGGNRGRYGYQGDFAEKDEETGWNHFELREYDPIVGRSLSVDPARQFHSPYIWVGNNPILATDPTGGVSPIYDYNGNFLGTDSEEFNGEILIINPILFAAFGGEGLDHRIAEDIGVGINDANLNYEALSNIFTDILSTVDGVDLNRLYNRRVSIYGTYDFRNKEKLFNEALINRKGGPANTGLRGINFPENATGTGNIRVSVNFIRGNNRYLTTVENVQNMLGVHEFIGHGLRGFEGTTEGELNAYSLQTGHSTYVNTTSDFKSLIENNIKDLNTN